MTEDRKALEEAMQAVLESSRALRNAGSHANIVVAEYCEQPTPERYSMAVAAVEARKQAELQAYQDEYRYFELAKPGMSQEDIQRQERYFERQRLRIAAIDPATVISKMANGEHMRLSEALDLASDETNAAGLINEKAAQNNEEPGKPSRPTPRRPR